MIKETATEEDNWNTKVFNKGIQTNVISLNKCDSCASAMLCIKNLLQSFNEKEFKMPLNERQFLRPKIFDITQFGCMLQTTTAVEKGVNRLYEKLFLKEQERGLLYKENLQLKDQAAEDHGKIALLQREADMFKEKWERDSVKITLLQNKNEELCQMKNKQDFQIKTLNEIVSNLNKSIKAYHEEIFKIACETANQNSSYKIIMKNQLHLMKFSTLLQTKVCAIEDEYSSMENSFKLLEQLVDNICKRINKSNDTLTKVEMKLSKVNEEDRGVLLLESKLQQLKKTLGRRNQEKKSFQIKGNPIEDLTRQIEENNAAIKKLESENIKLKCIISKLTCLNK